MKRCSNLRTESGERRSAIRVAAFTLAELLVVIAVLALLAATQLPALTRVKSPTKQVQCMNNLRQLTMAWRIYAEDNNDQAVNNFGLNFVLTSIADGTFKNWVNNFMTWDTDPVNTNLNYVRNGKLTLYMGDNLSAFKCPADNYLAPAQRAAGFTARTRSYAINGFLGPYGDGLPKYQSGKNNNYPEYRQWLKATQIAQPANIMLAIEEHPDSINDGIFNNDPNLDTLGQATGTKWSDAPASFHGGGANVTFTDGHSETHYWKSGTTKFPIIYVTGSARSPPLDASGKDDLTWMVKHQAVLYPNY